MQDQWTLFAPYRQIVEAQSIAIARNGRIVELHLKMAHCDLRYRTQLYWR